MKATILLTILVAVFKAGTEAHSHSCRSYWCGKFCGTADCTHYVCIVLTLGKICICQNCRRIKNPYRAAQVAKSINDLDFTPIMRSMENLNNRMDML